MPKKKDWVEAYIHEFGHPPLSRQDRERAGAYRYGFEAGAASAREETLRTLARRLQDEADGPPPRD